MGKQDKTPRTPTDSDLCAVNEYRRLKLEQTVDLGNHLTMRVGGSARSFSEGNSVADVE
jgi:hypothetical protein